MTVSSNLQNVFINDVYQGKSGHFIDLRGNSGLPPHFHFGTMELYWPITQPSNGQVIRVDGQGNLTFVDVGSLVGLVDSITAGNSSLTISPTTGNVVASLNLANPNTWTGLQTFTTTAVGTQCLVVKEIANQTAHAFEAQDSSGVVYASIGPKTLTVLDNSTHSFYLNCFLPSNQTGAVVASGAQINVTSGNVPVTNPQYGTHVKLLDGGGGDKNSYGHAVTALYAVNFVSAQHDDSVWSTGAGYNTGVTGIAQGTTAGANIGVVGMSVSSSTINIGGYFNVYNSLNSPAQAIGVVAAGYGAIQNIGIFASLSTGTGPGSTGSSALIADNQSSGNGMIAQFNTLGTIMVQIDANGVPSVLTGKIVLGAAASVVGSIALKNASNSNTLTLQSGVTGSNLTFTLPTADGTSGQVLQTNGSGVLSWVTGGGGGGSGTVTSVATDSTLTGGPITTTGTLGINLANANVWTAKQTISGATISGGSSTDNFFNVTGTLPTVPTATTNGVTFNITSAGSSAQLIRAGIFTLFAGYTGTNRTTTLGATNQAAGTGAAGWTGSFANYSMFGQANSVGVGHNVSGFFSAIGSSTLNLGTFGFATSATGSSTVNVGAAGMALNAATTNVGGFFGLLASAPTLTSAALIADCGATSNPIFVGQAAGVSKFVIDQNGVLTAGATGAGFTVALTTSTVTGTLPAAQMPALTGDITTSAGAVATTLATVASAGTTGSSTAIPVITIDAKGRTTGITTAAVVAPAGTLTGTTLASNVVTSSLTTVGTIGSGVWQGSAIAASFLPALNAITAPTADVSLNSHKITNLTDPASAQDAATKNYVDMVAQGLNVKASCRATTTANITLSGAQTIDGVSVIAGDRVLVKNQTTGADNGLYLAAAGAWTRTTDADTSGEMLTGTYTFIGEGTLNSATAWILTTPAPITLGTTSLTFAQFSGGGTYTAGAGLTLSGSQFLVGAGQITNAMLAGSIASSKLVGSDIATVGTLTAGATGAGFTVALTTSTITGTLPAAQMPALTGDITTSAGAVATTLATVASAGTTGSSTAIPVITIDVKGRTTSITTAAVVAPAGTLTGTTLAANVVTSSLTTVGTIGSGVWQGTAVGTTYGGTGLDTSAAANGKLLIGNGSGLTLATLTAGSGVSITNGAGTITITATGSGGSVTSVATDATLTGGPITTTGTLGIDLTHANTWTAQTTFSAANALVLGAASTTAGAIVLQNATNANTVTVVSGVSASSFTLTLPTGAGSNGQILSTNGSGVLSWASAGGTGTVTSIATDVTLTGGTITTTGTLGIDLTHANTWTGTPTVSKNNITTTSTDALILSNTTAADGSVTAQWSPRMRLTGTVWDTGTVASVTHDWIQCVQMTSGNPATSKWTLSQQIGGGGYNTIVSVNGSLSGGSSTDNFLNITRTLPSTLSAIANGVLFNITSAGSSSQIVRAVQATLLAGYTGSSRTMSFGVTNSAAGTGAAGWTGLGANYSVFGQATSVGAGHNVSGAFIAIGSSTLNLGTLGLSTSASGSSTVNVGAAGFGLNAATTNVGGFFALLAAAPTLTSAALIADNGGTANPIFIGQISGTSKFVIDLNGNAIVYPGSLTLGTASATAGSIVFQNATNANTTTISPAVASGNRTLTLPNVTGTFITTGDTGTVTNTMLAGSITAAKLVGTDIATVGTLTAGATGAGFTVDLSTSTITGTLPVAQMPALTGDITTSAGAVATTLATVASAGTTGSSTAIPVITINAKGLTTTITTAAVVAPAGTLTGTTLASNVVTSSLTTVGTVGTGVWQGTAIAAAFLPALNGITAPTADVSFNSHKITNLTDPTTAQDAATKNYVDTVAQGLDPKVSCRAATTANITLSGAQTIDGVSVIAGDRVLVKNQTTAANNGLYLAASGAWSRTTDADTAVKLTTGAYTFIEEGTVNGSTAWTLTTPEPITLGTTALTFTQFSGAGTYTAGAGLTLTGAQFLVGAGQITNAMLGGSIAASKLVGSDIATVGTLTAGATGAGFTVALSTSTITGTLPAAQMPALTGDITTSAGAVATTLASVASAGTTGSSTAIPVITIDVKGRTTTITTAAVIAPAGTLTGTTLAANVVTSSLTTVGTIGTGVWQGTKIGTLYGGTNIDGSAAANGKLLIGNGSGYTLATLTAGAGISIANGSGTITPSLDLTAVNAWTGQQYFARATLTDASSITWNLNTQQTAKVTLGGNRTLANPSNMVDGGTYTLRVIQDGTGSRTLAFGNAYRFPGGIAFVASTAAGAIDLLTFECDGTKMDCVGQKAFS